jgi:superfamily I DNA/RNA helicase
MSALNPVVAIGDDILDCLSRLPKGTYAKAAKFIMRFRSDPRSSGINYERIKNAKDENLRSVRIDQNLRGIVLAPEKGNVYVLLWVDNHDDAYKWALNRMARVNVASGSLQVFSVDEQITEVANKENTADTTPAQPGLFDDLKDRELGRLGVPEELISTVRTIQNDIDLEGSEDQLPPDAYEGLYMKAAGYTYEEVMAELERQTEDSSVSANDFEAALQTDESKRKFWVVDNEDELQRMLDEPLEKWRVFLHPSQRKLVERDWNGPVRALGGAGTGKTVVAMHRARWLIENRFFKPTDKLLFTTFTSNLAADIEANLRTICEADVLSRIEVINLDAWVGAYLRARGESRKIVFPGDDRLDAFWNEAVGNYGQKIGLATKFFQDEWSVVIQANSVSTQEDYLRVPRVGRGTRLDRRKRAEVWKVFEAYRARLDEEGLLEPDDAYRLARETLSSKPHTLPYKAVIIDEAQDMGPEAFKLLRSLIPIAEDKDDKNCLFIVGDGHQRIYGRRVVLGRCGVNVRGRSRKLRINYRTSDEIRKWALSILEGIEVDDLDDGRDDLMGYKSLFHGPVPEVKNSKNQSEEIKHLVSWIRSLEKVNFSDKDICVIARDNKTIKTFEGLLEQEGFETLTLRRRQAENRQLDGVRLATMHRSKGLEFMAVALVALNDGLIPNVLALRSAPDEAGKEEVINAERMLLYVAATRAKKRLLASSSGKPSEILQVQEKT